MRGPEGKIQDSIVRYLKEQGYMVIKLIETSVSGIPDLLVISPLGEYTWLEVKSSVGRTRAIQDYIIDKLRTRNCRVYVVSSLETVKDIFDV
jgi:Holliday junction resolvase